MSFKNILLTIAFLFLTTSAWADSSSFIKEETLVYDIRWSFIPAGVAILKNHPDTDIMGRKAHHFSLTAETNKALDILYKFREKVDSYVSLGLGETLLYRKVQSGRSARDITVSFNWQQKTAQYKNFANLHAPIKLPPGTLDPLSALFFLRAQTFTETQSITRPVTDGKKIVIGQALFLGKEQVRINEKVYETYKLEPDMKDVRGVFEKSKGAKMYIWVTTDARRLPVKIKSKVIIGSFIAELVEYSTGKESSDE